MRIWVRPLFLDLITFFFFHQDKDRHPAVRISRREAAPRPYTRRGRGRGATSSLSRAANGRSSARGKRATSVSARRNLMPPPSTPLVMPHQENMEIMHHEEMTANVDLVPGNSNGGSGNHTDGRYAQMSIRLHLFHHYQPQGMSASRPQSTTAYPPAHNSSHNKPNNSPTFYTNNPNHW